MKPEHRCARSGFMVATHDSSTLSGTGAVCLAHWRFWWQSMPWQRVMSLSTGTLQLSGDGEELFAGCLSLPANGLQHGRGAWL